LGALFASEILTYKEGISVVSVIFNPQIHLRQTHLPNPKI
jgi:hypothetical protein